MLSLVLSALLLQPGKVEVDLTYVTRGDEEIKLDFYHADGAGPHPVAVVIHGGTWMTGKKEDMEEICIELAKNGISSATINYRLAPAHKWPAMDEDARESIKWLYSNSKRFSIDPDRTCLVGASAGAQIALHIGLQDHAPNLKGIVNLFAPTDFAHDFDPALTQLLAPAILGEVEGGYAPLFKSMSPVSHVSKNDPPVFTIHGVEDELVPVEQARRLDRALKTVGVSHEMILIEGMGHELPTEKPEVAAAVSRALAFLKKQL
jgi:acetyl esterase/lipase